MGNNGVCICFIGDKLFLCYTGSHIFGCTLWCASPADKCLHSNKRTPHVWNKASLYSTDQWCRDSLFYEHTGSQLMTQTLRRRHEKQWWGKDSILVFSSSCINVKLVSPTAKSNPYDPADVHSHKMREREKKKHFPSMALHSTNVWQQTPLPLLSFHPSLSLSLSLCKLGMLFMLH